MSTPALVTRQPTRTVSPPLVLLEGGEGTGKSWAAAVLSASKRVGRTLWLELGETTADEYGLVKDAEGNQARFELINHDGTWASIYGQVQAARAEAVRAKEAAEPPVVLVIDTMSAEWELLHGYVDKRQRNNKVNKAKLADDPNADLLPAGRAVWNDANARHRQLMTLLQTFPGPVIMCARGGFVSQTDPETGQPVPGKFGQPAPKEWRVEGQKKLGSQCTLWIRLDREAAPRVVKCRSVRAGIQVGVDTPVNLDKGWTLDQIIFDQIQYNATDSPARELVEMAQDRTPEEIRDEAVNPHADYLRLRELWKECQRHRYEAIELPNETGDTENLMAMIVRLGKEREPAAAVSARPAATTAEARPAPTPAAAAPASDPAPAADAPAAAPSAASAPDEALQGGPADGEAPQVITDPAWLTQVTTAISRLPLGPSQRATNLTNKVNGKGNARELAPGDQEHLLSLIEAKVQQGTGVAA